mgnify:CR=1 FL=1
MTFASSSATHPFVWDLYFELWQGYLPHDARKRESDARLEKIRIKLTIVKGSEFFICSGSHNVVKGLCPFNSVTGGVAILGFLLCLRTQAERLLCQKRATGTFLRVVCLELLQGTFFT